MPLRHFSLYAALFASGAAALAYQATWGRMLQRVFGVSDLAVATVLAAFFLGLGLGAAVGGRYAKRMRRPALGYALLEASVGAYALLSLLLIPNIHHLYAAVGAESSFAALTAVRLAIALAVLLPPTMLMGATLPVLVAVLARGAGHWSSPATSLYATNTFGAMFGAGATGLWLLPQLGQDNTIVLAAALSLAAAVIVYLPWRSIGAQGPSAGSAPKQERRTDEQTAAEQRTAPGGTSDASSPRTTATEGPAEPADDQIGGLGARGPRLAFGLAALAGFASLAGEVLWTRVLRMIVQGTTQAFSLMLVNYLAGIAIGSLIAKRFTHSDRGALRALGIAQMLLAVLTILAMVSAPQVPRLMALLEGQAELTPHRIVPIVMVSAVLLLPLALVIGTAIPLAWRIAGGSPEQAAQRAGRVLAFNTLGGLAGSLAAGFALVPTFGVEASIVVIVVLHLTASAIALRTSASTRLAPRVAAIAGPAAVAALVFVWSPSIELPFLLHGRNDPINAVIRGPGAAWREPIAFLEEGRNTTVTVLTNDHMLRLYNDGRPESGFGGGEPGFGPELALLGALPSLFCRERDQAMVIGLGAGHTTSVLLGGPFRRVDVVELEEGVVRAAHLLYEAREKPFPLDDQRARLTVDDARTKLVLAAPGTYDAVVSQPSHPWLAGSSALYTKEFFEEVDRALKPGGVLALWVNLFRMDVPHLRSVVHTLVSVFPHVLAFVTEGSSFVLCAAREPLQLDDEVANRLGSPGLRPFLGPHNLDELLDLVAALELDDAAATGFGQGAPLITDDRPSLEFALARLPNESSLRVADIDRAVADVPWLAAATFDAMAPRERVDALVARIQQASPRRRALARIEASLPGLEFADADRAYVLGSLAEARGDVHGALGHYGRAGTAKALHAADRLRSEQRLFRQTVTAAAVRIGLPAAAQPLLSAALAVGDRTSLATAARVGAAVAAETDAPLLQLVQAYLAGGCAALLRDREVVDRLAQQDEHVAFFAETCAVELGDLESARRIGEWHARRRRITAMEEHRLGAQCAVEGNGGGAGMHLRRALAANPAHGPAAATLARLLDRNDRKAEARAILTQASADAAGLPASTAAIAQAADQLGIQIAGLSAGPAGSASSLAPPPQMNEGATGGD